MARSWFAAKSHVAVVVLRGMKITLEITRASVGAKIALLAPVLAALVMRIRDSLAPERTDAPSTPSGDERMQAAQTMGGEGSLFKMGDIVSVRLAEQGRYGLSYKTDGEGQRHTGVVRVIYRTDHGYVYGIDVTQGGEVFRLVALEDHLMLYSSLQAADERLAAIQTARAKVD